MRSKNEIRDEQASRMSMKVDNSWKRQLFFLGLRIAGLSGTAVTLLMLFVLHFWLAQPPGQVLVLSLGTGLLTLLIVYLVSWRVAYQRVGTISRISRNIAQKQFDDYDNLKSGHKDELDFLITQLIRASKTVEREIQRLNKIENYRKEFIGDISHELKTPIFAIQGFVETLIDGALEDPDVNRVFLNKAMRHVNRLTYLTKDLMEISRLETGELKSTIQNLNLRNVVQEVVESLQYKAQEESVEIRIRPIDGSLNVRADHNQIRQVLINLIENGMKYNHTGGYVEIGLNEAYTGNHEKVLLFVRDSGIGIDNENLKRVTERFFRVDKSRSREKGGTGLGLSIVKHIIEAHEEELFIDSIPDQGSTFSFTLTRATLPAYHHRV